MTNDDRVLTAPMETGKKRPAVSSFDYDGAESRQLVYVT